jgi:HSP20 family protein
LANSATGRRTRPHEIGCPTTAFFAAIGKHTIFIPVYLNDVFIISIYISDMTNCQSQISQTNSGIDPMNYYITRSPIVSTRLFNELLQGATDLSSISHKIPAIELSTTDNAVILKAELPGLSASDLDLEVTPEAIGLKGQYRRETTTNHQQIHRSELRSGSFRRVIPLPVAVVHTAATAEFVNGLLTVTIPKLVETKPTVHKVAIGSGTTEAITSDDPIGTTDRTLESESAAAEISGDAWQ